MAYIFPVNPFDGQIYPVPAIPGALQYIWDQDYQVWFIFSPLGVQSVTGLLPIIVSDGTDNAVVSIIPATINVAGSMSADDKLKLDNIPTNAGVGTVTSIATGPGLSGGTITSTGTINLEPATKLSEGGVIVGDNIDVSQDGTISIPTARFGVQSINIGPGLVGAPTPLIGSGTISAALATRLSVGSVRIGTGLTILPDGTISVAGSLATVGILAWASVAVTPASSPPAFTLLEGYNISSIAYAGTATQPYVRIAFQTPFANAFYGFAFGAQSDLQGSSSTVQKSQVITAVYKTAAFVDLQLVTLSTTNNASTSSTGFVYNDWGNSSGLNSSGLAQFDIAIIDTQVF